MRALFLFLLRMLNANLPVRVYWNYKHQCYSIFQAGAVRASARQVRLVDVEFRVREAGRQKALEQGRKVIHAYAIGTVADYCHPDNPNVLPVIHGQSAFYNPHQFATFVDQETLEPLTYADEAYFGPEGVRYLVNEKLAA